MTESQAARAAYWTPLLATLGTVTVAAIGAWSGCQDLRSDVRSVREAVDAQTAAIDQLSSRVDKVDDRSVAAKLESQSARALCSQVLYEHDRTRGASIAD